MNQAAKRTDNEIARNLLRALRDDPEVPDEQLTVTVKDGSVTLRGTVEWGHQKDAAENCAKRVIGIHSIANLIQVQPAVAARENW